MIIAIYLTYNNLDHFKLPLNFKFNPPNLTIKYDEFEVN